MRLDLRAGREEIREIAGGLATVEAVYERLRCRSLRAVIDRPYNVHVKALVKAHSEPGLWLQDIPEPVIGINDVRIRVLRTGICGTDVHIFDWNDWARQTIPVPMVIGHEFVGEIV